ncbi:MAG: trypsin-like peptidase domain-containing protein [Myxococcales bacterium]|nr:trypsin-like peptidase domain-containing protein [Myxococcales bacterium]
MIILAPACWEEQQPPRHLGKPAPLPDQPLTLPPPSEDPPLAEAPDPTLVPDAAPKAAPAPVPALSDGAGIEDERNTIAVFQTAAPATVFVTQSQLVRNRFTLRVDEIPAGTGSGFIWDDQGHVVTNFHVVAGGDHFSITLWDGRTVPATLVGGDPQRDIAVLALQLPAEEAGKLTSVTLPPAPSGLMVGQKTLAIGNPFGLDHTLTVGVISALEREVVGFGGVTIRNMIQTDASINPGNSGGPLLDSSGRLIGMNTMIFSKSGSSAGIGFAVPVDTIRRLVPQIIQYGRPRRASLGIEVVPDRLAVRAGVRGVIIETVHPGSPAAKAGLRGLSRAGRDVLIGDVIVGMNEHEIGNFDDLFNALDNYEPGARVDVKVRRAGEIFALETVLEVFEAGVN